MLTVKYYLAFFSEYNKDVHTFVCTHEHRACGEHNIDSIASAHWHVHTYIVNEKTCNHVLQTQLACVTCFKSTSGQRQLQEIVAECNGSFCA